MPLGFLGCFLGSMLSKPEGKAERGFDELHVRAETGLGAEVPIDGAGLRERAPEPRLRRGSASRSGLAEPGVYRRGIAARRGEPWRPERTQERVEGLERELEGLLDIESFEPPEDFVAEAAITDESIAAEAAADPVGYWEEKASDLDWFERWDTALDDSDPPFYKWFEGGKLNASHNCLDRHVENGLGDRVAFHWRGEEGEERDVTYADLLGDVQRLANALKDRGVGKGDVVGIFLPMIPEVAVAMLACARIGAPHNVVFGGFSPDSVKDRMQFSEAKALITADGARRKGKTARGQAGGRRLSRRRAVDRDRRRRPQHRAARSR